MQVSLNWLQDYIDLSGISLDEIVTTLTDLGLEVEGVTPVSPLQGDVVVGEIMEAAPHPDADKLQICQVNIGKDEHLTIVCGAPNARPGLKVACACIGATLPGPFKIKASKIRGQKSEGMLCSGEELGLSSDSDGILELSSETTLGLAISELFALEDTVIEIGLTPNRADCLGYVGIARDLAAKLGRPLTLPDIPDLEVLSSESRLKTEDVVQVKVDDPDDCARFSALAMQEVSAVDSPVWLRKRLENSGMRPINLLVDVTNYVMLEFAQPIHAYDRRDLRNQLIHVRRASEAEPLTTLDEVSRSLTPGDLVIADGEGAIGLAGVMGGQNSEVKSDTKDIVIEVAHFNPSLIRKTSKRLSLHSEASHRFERGIDIANIDTVSRRVAALICQVSNELIDSGHLQPEQKPIVATSMIDAYPVRFSPSRIALRLSRARDLTGIRTLSQEECQNYLKSLGFEFLDRTEDRLVFEVPSFRRDIVREVDLIEEVARLHGYKSIPMTLPMMEIGTLPEKPWISFFEDIKLTAATQGFTEIISFPFIGQQHLDDFLIPKDHPIAQVVELVNPLIEDQKYMRSNLAFCLLDKLRDNQRHGNLGCKLFEVGRSFHRLYGQSCPEPYQPLAHLYQQGLHIQGRAAHEDRPIERTVFAAVIDQPARAKSWDQTEQAASFFDLKALVMQIFDEFSLPQATFLPLTESSITWVHPKRAALVKIDDKVIGYVGELHPMVAKNYELSFTKPPILAELDLELLWTYKGQKQEFESAVIKFPSVMRDIAIVVEESCTHQDVSDAVDSFKRRKHLKKINLFDVYTGENVASGKKSLAYSLSFQSPVKTLTDKEVEKELQALLDHFKDRLSAELR